MIHIVYHLLIDDKLLFIILYKTALYNKSTTKKITKITKFTMIYIDPVAVGTKILQITHIAKYIKDRRPRKKTLKTFIIT